MAYSDYSFYTEVYYGDQIREGDFPRLSERASDYLRAATKGISDKVQGDALEAVKKAVCAIAEVWLDESILMASAYSGEQMVASESVGGWSKSYKAATVSDADLANIENRKREALRLYLGNVPAFAGLFQVRSYPCQHRAV